MSDGELVIFHDLSVDRLTADTGRVRGKSLAQMLSLDLGPKAVSPMTGAYVHTFEDFVRTVKGRGILMVELKVPGLSPSGIERRAVDIIRKYDAHASVVLSSFNPVVLYRVKRLDPKVRTALIFMDTFRMTWPQGVLLSGVLGVLSCPWLLMSNFGAFLGFILNYSALFGPMLGVMLADYYVIRKRQLNVAELYDTTPGSPNWYQGGFNVAGYVAVLVPGLVTMVRYLEVSWLIGVPAGFVLYVVLFPLLERRSAAARAAAA
jgi:hypothetical protein